MIGIRWPYSEKEAEIDGICEERRFGAALFYFFNRLYTESTLNSSLLHVMNLFQKTRHIKGSVLAFSLIVLAFMLISALSIATVSVTEKRASFATEKSSRSFQVADSGIEIILQKIYKDNYDTLNDLAASLGTTCNQGEISATLNSGTYVVSFYDNAGVKFVGADCSVTDWRDRVVRIKSEGVSGNTTRAVEAGVAPPGPACNGPQIYGGGFVTDYTTSYLEDNSAGNGASTASLSCGVTGPSSPAPGQLNIRFYMHNTSGCLVGFNSPITVSLPFSGPSNMWTCGGTTTYLDGVTCTATDCTITGRVEVGGWLVPYQRYESIIPRPSGL